MFGDEEKPIKWCGSKQCQIIRSNVELITDIYVKSSQNKEKNLSK